MNFQQITIYPIQESEQEILIALLSNIEFDSFQQEENVLKCFVENEKLVISNFENVINSISNSYEYKIETLPNKNWNKVWEANFQPIIIANEIYVKAPFHPENKEAKFTIIIDPKMSFGTGHHETTSLMLQQMLNMNFVDKKVFDYGCGTAILAIFAAIKGCENIVAIDHEDWAYKNAIENIENNKVTNIHLKKGKLEVVNDNDFDFIIANINKNVHLQSIKKLDKMVNKNATILLSGLMEKDKEDILKVTETFRWKNVSTLQNGEWIMMKFLVNAT